MHISLASPEDYESLVELLHELHRYYNPSSAVSRQVVNQHLLENLLGPKSPTQLVVARDDGNNKVVGLAAAILLHSLVEPQPGRGAQCLLKELFVSEAQRDRRIGRALVHWVAAYAAQQGCARIDWNVKASNSQGIAFYERLGAELVHDRLSLRLSQAGIKQLLAPEQQCD